MKKILKYSALGTVGGVLYNILEILWRGRTHISMTFAGGISLVMIYILNEKARRLSLFKKSIIGAVIITVVEFVSGLIVNVKMGLHVWNYSDRTFHFMGQVCLLYSFFWFLLCIPVNFVCKKLVSRS